MLLEAAAAISGIIALDTGSAHSMERFAGIWAQSCAHLSGETFIFHDGDRLKIVDLDCKILGWKRVGSRWHSRLSCILDGQPSRAKIAASLREGKLQVEMDGRRMSLEHCP